MRSRSNLRSSHHAEQQTARGAHCVDVLSHADKWTALAFNRGRGKRSPIEDRVPREIVAALDVLKRQLVALLDMKTAQCIEQRGIARTHGICLGGTDS